MNMSIIHVFFLFFSYKVLKGIKRYTVSHNLFVHNQISCVTFGPTLHQRYTKSGNVTPVSGFGGAPGTSR